MKKYTNIISSIYSFLKNSSKSEFNNRYLSKIFKYYSCI